jgi:hypothetical protein
MRCKRKGLEARVKIEGRKGNGMMRAERWGELGHPNISCKFTPMLKLFQHIVHKE